jgi:hypothetical protein
VRKLPFRFAHEVRLEVDGKRLLVTHGSPESIDEHIYHNTPAKRLKTLAASATLMWWLWGILMSSFSER